VNSNDSNGDADEAAQPSPQYCNNNLSGDEVSGSSKGRDLTVEAVVGVEDSEVIATVFDREQSSTNNVSFCQSVI
jgi:hypothetical protein